MASDLFGKGNEAFINEQYESAIKLYTQALEHEQNRDDIYSNRAQAYLKLERYKEAVEDAIDAINLNQDNVKAHHRKGTGLFHLEDYQSAKEAFRHGLKLDAEDSFNFKMWIRKCEAELDLKKSVESGGQGEIGVSETKTTVADSQPSEPKPVTPEPQIIIPEKPKLKHDWYQTATHVMVNIFYKNCKQENANIEIQDRLLKADLILPNGEPIELKFSPLAHPVNPSASSFKILKSKIEVKLKKMEGLQWKELEGEEELAPAHPASDPMQYPSSSHYTRNWDKLSKEAEKEEKEEKKEGDAALNDLFKQIYSDGTEETKRAMMKSFYESGGTVLSTNWNEIGAKQTEVKPPDGMEYKKWES
ncbi:protein SGT1 homolog [Mya arenaria]|uniref:protein SGT1 homolog n=1 Tax=Mya arenaria TaxID=6604 RepID=UPI0022E29D28|nr:protein SGT1 homolog [Mya arenaria]